MRRKADEHKDVEASSGDGNDWGSFSGVIADSTFHGADFWGRDGRITPVVHRVCGNDFTCDVVLAAQYSDATHVSQLVYYRIETSNFCIGCGRGTGWHNDETLALHYDGKAQRYATRADYNGVGHFKLDRGHQAPVGSFNQDEVEADITNLPTNLSPQNAELNQKTWRYLEADVRIKATELSRARAGGETFIETITGPMYELPSAMLKSQVAKERWLQLIQTGGHRLSSKGVMKRDPVPWCPEETATGYEDDLGKKASITCVPRTNYSVSGDPRSDPNSLAMSFSAGSSRSTPLRIPLGYYKMFIVKDGAGGSRTCAFVFDQIGQCMLTSVPLFQALTHVDLSKTPFAKEAAKRGGEYTTEIDSDWCVPPDTVLGKSNYCLLPSSKIDDPSELTVEMFQEYWTRRPDDDFQ